MKRRRHTPEQSFGRLAGQPQAGAAAVARGGPAGAGSPRYRLGESTVPAERLAAQRPNHAWALDFQLDQTADGRILKLLHVVDEFTREALDVLRARRIDADRTVARLERLVAERGGPEHLRCDNGPELTANALRDCDRPRWALLLSESIPARVSLPARILRRLRRKELALLCRHLADRQRAFFDLPLNVLQLDPA